MHLMHHMHRTGRTQGEQEFGMNLKVYCWLRLEKRVIWEQEVVHRRRIAPTNDFKHLERVLVEPVLSFSCLVDAVIDATPSNPFC